MTDDSSGLTAALLTLTQHAERLGTLEASVSANLQQCEIATGGLTGAVEDLRAVVLEQGKLIEAVSDVVKSLVPPSDDDPGKGYTPRAPVVWWKLTDDQLRKEMDHLAAWVDQVYRPFYGHLAAGLGACYRDHPFCLVGLDVASELHSVLNLQPKRSASLLSAQAEYTTRILPALAEQWRVETSRCSHRPEPATGSAWRGAR